MSQRWGFTTSGFSMGTTSLALHKLLSSECSVCCRPWFRRYLWQAGAIQLHQLLTGHAKQLVQIHVIVGKLEKVLLLLLYLHHLARYSEKYITRSCLSRNRPFIFLYKMLFILYFLAQILVSFLFWWPYFQF